MSYRLGASSRRNLVGVHPDLVRVVERAIEITTQDFSVIEGLRSPKRQAELVRSGASRTADSRHLTGHAVDLAAYVGGRLSWDWPLYYQIADAMREAANELRIAVRWGGAWDARLNDLADTEAAVAGYVARRRAANQKAFIDGPHFELPRATWAALTMEAS